MRRRKSKLKFILIGILLCTAVGVSYAYLSTSLKIHGSASGHMSSGGYIVDASGNPDLSITDLSINKWQSGNVYNYQYHFSLNNKSATEYDNFKIILTYNYEVSNVNIWNYSYSLDGKKITIVNNTIHLKANSLADINFILGTSASNLELVKIKLEATTSTTEIDPKNFLVKFTPTNSWGNYVYQYNVEVTNKTGTVITYWQITLPLNDQATYENGWNGIFSSDGKNLIIKNADYNGRLENNASTTFGLQLKTATKDFIPTEYKVLVR